jgi:hypothetical protein
MTSKARSTTDWSGSPFGAPGTTLVNGSIALIDSASSTLAGQDAVTPGGCTHGLPVYGGYFNGLYADLNTFKADFPSAIILSITPTGMKGARCVDCEPGDATVAEAAAFIAANLPTAPAGGRNDGGKPMAYCSASDSQAVISAVSGLGISRSQWLLWSAHWTNSSHICAPSVCGYPAADATQYASNSAYDSDIFYSYCFTPVAPPAVAPEWPLAQGSTYTADIKTLQKNLVKHGFASSNTKTFPVDGDFGPLTVAAVKKAETSYFVPTGTCDQALYSKLNLA